MKDFFIRDSSQHENKVVTSSFVVAAKQIKSKKTGEPYLSLTLADRTGQLDAKMWDNVADCMESFEQDDFLKVKGLINKYNNRFQLTIHKLRKMQESEVDYADYLPKCPRDVDDLWRQLGEFVASVGNEQIRALLQAFMADAEIAQAYRTAPAAKTLHHAYIGGLLDHVISLMKLCDLALRNYPQLDRDLLIAGAFLHDIGKIHELAYARAFSYTTKGQLLGHMIIELEMLQAKLAQVPGFPPEIKILLEHLIISHHGEYEFGSPKLPMFPEALMLHYLDDLDSKMESMRAHFEREQEVEHPWTSYNPSLARPLLDVKKFLRGPKPAEVEPEQARVSDPSARVEDPLHTAEEPAPAATRAAAAAETGADGQGSLGLKIEEMKRKFGEKPVAVREGK